MTTKADTRSGRAGISMGKSIVEMINLMYQKDTAIRFIDALIQTLEDSKDGFK